MTIDDLPYEACIRVLAKTGQSYVEHVGYDAHTVSALLTAKIDLDLPEHPDWEERLDPKVFGPIAKRMLNEALASDDTRLRRLVDAEIAEQASPHGQMVDPITLSIGGGILISMAIISKFGWTKEKGPQVLPGFPGLAEVLKECGKILDKLMGGAAAGAIAAKP
jgi:hypothetical protein